MTRLNSRLMSDLLNRDFDETRAFYEISRFTVSGQYPVGEAPNWIEMSRDGVTLQFFADAPVGLPGAPMMSGIGGEGERIINGGQDVPLVGYLVAVILGAVVDTFAAVSTAHVFMAPVLVCIFVLVGSTAMASTQVSAGATSANSQRYRARCPLFGAKRRLIEVSLGCPGIVRSGHALLTFDGSLQCARP